MGASTKTADQIEMRVIDNVGSINSCRAWVRGEAARIGDPGVKQGDYECGVGEVDRMGDLTVYRLTVR
jgi:hypothetical protein